MKPIRVIQDGRDNVWIHLTKEGQVTQTVVLDEQEAFDLLNDLIVLIGREKPRSNVISLSEYR